MTKRLYYGSMKKADSALGVLCLSLSLGWAVVQGSEQSGERGSAFPSFLDDGDRQSLLRVIETTGDYLKRIPPDRSYPLGPYQVSAANLLETLILFRTLAEKNETNPALHEAIVKNFDIVQADGIDGKGEVLFTGYYEPILEARATQNGEFRFPLYRKPDDLVELDLGEFKSGSSERIVGRVREGKLIPYYARGEIERNRTLEGKGLELAWIRDPIALFFLHIQGSGLLKFENGERRRVHYDGSNGRPYRSIGKLLRDSRRIPAEGLSMQAIRGYLVEHPQERESILHHNESYIFFQFVNEGPLGNLGVPLTEGRSIAIDPLIFPRGGLAYFITEKPRVDPNSGKVTFEPLTRFALSQDTGSAIQGAGRVDLFWGTGKEAEEIAGRMMARGSLYFLVKKGRLRGKKEGGP
jgi:membrane-bound lytic murein transglycosylase A